MNFLKRITTLVYALLLIGSGTLFILLAVNTFSVDYWSDMVSIISDNSSYRAAIGVAGGILFIIGVIAPIRLGKKIKSSKMVGFKNPDGEVTVAITAIEDYVKKIAKGIAGIKDVRSKVLVNKKGINITAKISMSAGANIPESTERVQMEIKHKIQEMLGVEEKINTTVHINKIAKSGARDGSHTDVSDDVENLTYMEEE